MAGPSYCLTLFEWTRSLQGCLYSPKWAVCIAQNAFDTSSEPQQIGNAAFAVLLLVVDSDFLSNQSLVPFDYNFVVFDDS